MRFVLLAWLLSRALVIAVLLSAGPLDAFVHWDGAWYGSIVEHGYEYAADGSKHNVAFFPLLPVVALPLVREGMPWALAAAILSNAAFLGALAVLYQLARKRHDDATARWCVLVACLLPASLFCSVGYPQALFLLCSAFALYMYATEQFGAGGIAAAFASASSGLGIPLVAGLFIDGAIRKRYAAMAAAVLGCIGIGSFMFYSQVRFGDAFAFVHVQRAWRHGWGFDLPAWIAMAKSLATLDGFRQNAPMLLVPAGLIAVVVEARRLGSTMTIYALLALAVLIFSGEPFSVDRNAYAIAPVLLAVAAILRRVPYLGYAVLAVAGVILIIDAGRFAHFEWVAYVPLSAPM